MPPTDIPRFSLAHSIGWTAAAQGIGFALSLAGGMITARLLLPQDYAVMAMIAPLIGAAQIVQTFGLSNAIVNAKALTKPQLDKVFWLVLAASLTLGLLIAVVGPYLGYWLTGRSIRLNMLRSRWPCPLRRLPCSQTRSWPARCGSGPLPYATSSPILSVWD